MKIKFIMLLLAVSLFFSLMTPVSANSNVTLHSDLTCDNKNEVIKQTGDIITVTYTLTNITNADGKYFMLAHTNEFYYDYTFFEYVSGSATSNIDTIDTLFQRWGDGKEYSVSFNGMPMENWNSTLVVGTFQLKVIATEGSSTIYSKDGRDSIASASEDYAIIKDNLTVTIGDPAPDYVVEVADYVEGKKIVLAYTNNNEISFAYNGETMYDVTSKEYAYSGTEEFASGQDTKVYALVVDAISNGTLDDYKDNVSFINDTVDEGYVISAPESDLVYDLNNSGKTDIGDVISAYGVLYADSNIYPSFMNLILRADINNDKCVNEIDINIYTSAFSSTKNK